MFRQLPLLLSLGPSREPPPLAGDTRCRGAADGPWSQGGGLPGSLDSLRLEAAQLCDAHESIRMGQPGPYVRRSSKLECFSGATDKDGKRQKHSVLGNDAWAVV